MISEKRLHWELEKIATLEYREHGESLKVKAIERALVHLEEPTPAERRDWFMLDGGQPV